MRVEVDIAPGVAGAHEYLAWVAYPGINEAAARKRWVNAAGVIPFKAMGQHPPKELRGLKTEHQAGIYHRGIARLNNRRRPAVRLALKRMTPEALGGLRAMEAYKQLLSELPADFGYSDDVRNVRKHCEQESRPALAMAMPLACLTLEPPALGLSWHDLVYRLDFVGWVDWAIAMANEIAPAIEQDLQPMRLLVPERLDGTVPQLKSPVSFPLNWSQIGVVDSQHQLAGRTE